jgi:hypothetical protein
MKNKKIFSTIILIFVIIFALVYFNKVLAFGGGTSFGGKIYSAVSTEVQQQEAAGYICTVPGQTITVLTTKNSMKSFFIPMSTVNRTGKTIMNGKYILGLYRPVGTVITCPHSSGVGGATTVELPTIYYFGTS